MEKNGLYTGMLTGLEEVNLNARARKQAEGQMSRAAAILSMLMGKPHRSGANKAEREHAAH
jgi:hypothetical protein